MRHLIDTNVAVAANGRDTHACAACQLTCVELLLDIASTQSRKRIILDDSNLIIEEYSRHLNFRGQPGVGDIFFKYLHDHRYMNGTIELVSVNENTDESTGFDELPVNTFDPSDRKFIAAAIVSSAVVVNAVDTDWHQQKDFVDSLGVSVNQICPEHGCVD